MHFGWHSSTSSNSRKKSLWGLQAQTVAKQNSTRKRNRLEVELERKGEEGEEEGDGVDGGLEEGDEGGKDRETGFVEDPSVPGYISDD